jgi:hypothetical protein
MGVRTVLLDKPVCERSAFIFLCLVMNKNSFGHRFVNATWAFVSRLLIPLSHYVLRRAKTTWLITCRLPIFYHENQGLAPRRFAATG